MSRFRIPRTSWRGGEARRRARDRDSRASEAVTALFLGLFIAPALAALGLYCFHAEGIPTGRGHTMTGGLKDAVGMITVAAGFALHVGFAWPRIPGLRRIWLPALGLAALAALAGLVIFSAGIG